MFSNMANLSISSKPISSGVLKTRDVTAESAGQGLSLVAARLTVVTDTCCMLLYEQRCRHVLVDEIS